MTPFTHAMREREMINDLIEELCGARLTFNYMRIGGVAWDLPPGWREKALAYLDHLEPILDEYNALISYNKIYIERLANVGADQRRRGDRLQPGRPEPARLRRQVGCPQGHSLLGLSRFRVRRFRSARGEWGTLGDAMDRYMMRIREMARVGENPAPGAHADARRFGAGQGRAQLQAACRRMPDPRRERARRHGMVRRQRRHRLSVAGPRAHRIVRRDGDHRRSSAAA